MGFAKASRLPPELEARSLRDVLWSPLEKRADPPGLYCFLHGQRNRGGWRIEKKALREPNLRRLRMREYLSGVRDNGASPVVHFTGVQTYRGATQARWTYPARAMRGRSRMAPLILFLRWGSDGELGRRSTNVYLFELSAANGERIPSKCSDLISGALPLESDPTQVAPQPSPPHPPSPFTP